MAPQYTCKVFSKLVQLNTLVSPLSDTSGKVSGIEVALDILVPVGLDLLIVVLHRVQQPGSLCDR